MFKLDSADIITCLNFLMDMMTNCQSKQLNTNEDYYSQNYKIKRYRKYDPYNKLRNLPQ